MEKDQRVVEEIKKFIKDKCMEEFGYCGVAEGENMAMLNSGDGNIVISIKTD